MTDFFDSEWFSKRPDKPRTHFGAGLAPEDKKELSEKEDSESKKSDQD